MAATRTPSQTLLIAGIGFALACFVILNMVMQRLDPKYQEELQHEAERKAAEAQSAKSGQANGGAPKDGVPPMAGGGFGGNELAALGPDAVVGDKNGKTELTVGWRWTPDVQADPSKVYKTVDIMQKALPGVKIRVVNIDNNPSVKPGISQGAQTLMPLADDGSLAVNPAALHMLIASHTAPVRPK